SVLSVKDSMIAHLTACPHASTAAKKLAKNLKPNKSKQKTAKDTADSDASNDAHPWKRKRLLQVQKNMTQSQLKIIKSQFLRATISANLPFRWMMDPEIMKLFLMFRSRAIDMIPS
ncbi:hypothetical protein C8J57DRAFT_1027319, partial [Mycena rebaudengoi]